MKKVQQKFIKVFIVIMLAVNSMNIYMLSSQMKKKTSDSNPMTVYQEPVIEETAKLSEYEIIKNLIRDICVVYGNKVEPELVMSIVYHESRFQPQVNNETCIGLMQISTYWHMDRAEKLKVVDFYDPYSNILLGVDFLVELFDKYKDPSLVLMLYNMNHSEAFRLYEAGQISQYAASVLSMIEYYKKGEGISDACFQER